MLGGNGYAAFSHVRGSRDVGRAAVTKDRDDNWVFRIAPLRNIAVTHPYFHNGSARTLQDAVAIMGRSQLKRGFTPEETGQLIAFLNSLTGEFPLVPYPQLPRAAPAVVAAGKASAQ
jgi:cytochrome c peroxidase